MMCVGTYHRPSTTPTQVTSRGRPSPPPFEMRSFDRADHLPVVCASFKPHGNLRSAAAEIPIPSPLNPSMSPLREGKGREEETLGEAGRARPVGGRSQFQTQ